MKPITHEWIEKAEEDWDVALLALNSPKTKAYNAICFHTQQCAEKYLKARLQEANLVFPKTHNLPALLALVLPVEASWNVLKVALTKLDGYSVEFRYPGRDAVAADAQDALLLCR